MNRKTPQAYPETFSTKMFTRGIILIVILVFFVSFVSAIPQTFNVHGRLLDSGGSPLEGTYSINFSIYDVCSVQNIIMEGVEFNI